MCPTELNPLVTIYKVLTVCRSIVFLVMAGCLVFVSQAIASETTYYNYNTLGRLILVDARRSTAQGSTTVYSYDASANRTNVDTSVVKYSVIMPSGQYLNVGETIGTDSTGYRLTLQRNGDLALYDSINNIVWHTNSTTGDHLVMQSDGNLVLYTLGNSIIWQTNTGGHSGAYLAVQADGNVVVYGSNSVGLWGRF